MTLKEFIEKWVCKNTLIRLWVQGGSGHRMLTHPTGKEVGMEWAALDGSSWQAKYTECEVIGVTDILCETYREAVNIVIKL